MRGILREIHYTTNIPYGLLAGMLPLVGVVAVIVLVAFLSQTSNRIERGPAVERLAEVMEVSKDEIRVIRSSNNNILVGKPHDVTFELEIGGKRQTGRCTSGTFSEMVCRVYSSGEFDVASRQALPQMPVSDWLLESGAENEVIGYAFLAAGLPEVEERDLEPGTYTNRQLTEMVGDPTKLLELLMQLPENDPASKRSILSFAVKAMAADK